MTSTPSPEELRDPMIAILVRVVAIQVEIKHMREDIDQLKRAVDGNGRPGLSVRVDRLERTERRRTWVERIIIAAALLVVVTSGIRLIAKVVSDSPVPVTVKTPEALP